MTAFVMFAFNVALIMAVNSNPFAFKWRYEYERTGRNLQSII